MTGFIRFYLTLVILPIIYGFTRAFVIVLLESLAIFEFFKIPVNSRWGKTIFTGIAIVFMLSLGYFLIIFDQELTISLLILFVGEAVGIVASWLLLKKLSSQPISIKRKLLIIVPLVIFVSALYLGSRIYTKKLEEMPIDKQIQPSFKIQERLFTRLSEIIWQVLPRKRVTLTHFEYEKSVEETYNKPYRLSEREILKLLKKDRLEKGELEYSVNSRREANEELVLCTVEIVKGFVPGISEGIVSQGIIVENLKAGVVLQQYLPKIYFIGIEGGSYLDNYGRLREKYGIDDFYLDINKDGVKELIIERRYDMDNSWLSTERDIYQPTSEGFKNLLPPEVKRTNGLGLGGLQDFDRDRIYELIILDNTWEDTGCTDHGVAPIKYLVYSWRDNGYRDVTEESPLYAYQVGLTSGWLKGLSERCIGKANEECFGFALFTYFSHQRAGREEEGWQLFLDLTRSVQDLTWPSKTCRDYVIRLRDEGKEITPPPMELLRK